MLAGQPFYQQELPAITPISPALMNIDLDAGLNETDRENLEDMDFQLPSLVFKNKTIEETLNNIKTKNRSIGQMLGKGPVGQKVEEKQKEIYQSQKRTLETYRQIIDGLDGAKQFVSTPKKAGNGLRGRTGGIDVIYYPSIGDLCAKLTQLRGRTGGIDVIYYSSIDDLCAKLTQLVAAKQAGHNGQDNNINSILDELLRVQEINKDEYNILYKNIFH